MAVKEESPARVTLFTALVGSRGRGLADEGSDEDIRGVFAYSTEALLRLGNRPKDAMADVSPDSTDERDTVMWELRHALTLLLRGNPHVMETFAADGVEYSDIGWDIRQLMFNGGPGSREVFDAHRNYARNCMRKALDYATTPHRREKHATNAIIALRQADAWFRLRRYPVSEFAAVWPVDFRRLREWRTGDGGERTEAWAAYEAADVSLVDAYRRIVGTPHEVETDWGPADALLRRARQTLFSEHDAWRLANNQAPDLKGFVLRRRQ